MSRTRLNGWLSFSLLLVAFCCSTVCCSTASAQPPEGGRRPGGFGGGFGGPGGGGSELMLLSNEQVQKELELVADQIADLNKLRDAQREQMRELFSGMRDLSDEDRRAKFAEIGPKLQERQKEARGKVNAILLPHQQDRLAEISLQLRGFGAIEDSEVAAKLKLSDEQKEKLAAIRTAQREKMGELFRQGGGEGDREAMREKFTKLRDENQKELLGVLSADQQEQFEKMKGKKFELDTSAFRGPGGAGGGRFGGRRPEGDGNRGDGNRGGDRPAPRTGDDK